VGPPRPDAAAAALAAAVRSAQVTIPEPLLPNAWHAQTLAQLRYGAALVSASLAHLPEAADERPRAHLVRQPHPTHPAFPSAPEQRLQESAALFERLSQDTLFFISYYSQGGYPQYLAARELRSRHHWRFHRAHRTWFQRHAEPAESGEEGERGSVVYFDESDWVPKVAANFLFSYADLADEIT
jgi:CCR4-NOT transcriptional regulation complex NOT5 subunit